MEEHKEMIGKEECCEVLQAQPESTIGIGSDEVLNKDISSVESEPESDAESESISKVNVGLIRDYPKSNKRVALYVDYYRVDSFLSDNCSLERSNTSSTHISPHGVEFKIDVKYSVGDLLKIDVYIPNYWSRKKKLVDYDYLANEEPLSFRILGRVIERVPSGSRYLVTLESLVIDDLDREILTSFIKGNSL